MKNKFLNTSFQTTLLFSVISWISFTTTAHAKWTFNKPYLSSSTYAQFLPPSQGPFNVNAYVKGDSDLDGGIPYGKTGEIDILVANLPFSARTASTTTFPTPLPSGDGYTWSVNNVSWVCTILQGADLISYKSLTFTIDDSPIPYYNMVLKLNLLSTTGTIVLQFDSEGNGQNESADGPTHYVITITVSDKDLPASLKLKSDSAFPLAPGN